MGYPDNGDKMTKQATLTQMIESSVSEILKDVGTSIPGHALELDAETQLAKVQIGVERVNRDGKTFILAPIVNVPILFPGGKFSVEYQIDEGDEGLIIISQRCIDAWKEEGGVASQPIRRKLDMQDALFIPGFRSKPNALSGFVNDGIRIRNEDGDQYVWLKGSGDVEIVSSSLKHNGVNVGADHKHAPGTYLDAESRPLTGLSDIPQ